MNDIYLDFEAPIAELQKKIDELEKLSNLNNIDVSKEVQALTGRLKEMMGTIYDQLTPWQRVQLSRHPRRPYALDYINMLCTNFTELSGDRRHSDDKAIVGGPAKFNGRPVVVIGTQKGRDMKSNLFRNFGWPQPEGYRKALRLMRLAEQAQIPILTFVDTPGAYPGVGSEERHIAEAIAVNLREMFNFTVPIIVTIIGEGGSGGAIGLGVGNKVLILENAYYSVITPEGCAAILWKDRKFAPKAAEALKITAGKLFELGVADAIVPEPLGGAHRDPEKAAELLKAELTAQLDELSKMSPAELKNQRYEKFRAYGAFDTVEAVADAVVEPETK